MYRGLIALIFCHFSVDLFTGIWPLFKKIENIDLAAAGAIAMVGGLVGNICQLYFGQIADKGNRRKYMFLGLILSSFACLYPYVHSNYLYAGLILITFVGSSAFHPAATGIAGRLTEHKKGAMISLFVCGGGLGLAMSQMAFSELYYYHNKQTAWLMLIPMICLVIAWFFLPASFSNSSKDVSLSKFLESFKAVFSRLKWLYLIEVVSAALNIGIIFLIPEVMREMDMGEVLENGGGHFFFIVGAVLLISFSGHIADRLGHKNTILCSYILALPLYYLFLNYSNISFELRLLCFLLVGGLFGICNPVGVAIGNKLMPKQASLVSALLMGAAWAAGNIAYLSVGLMARSIGAVASLNIWGLLIVLNIILVIFLKDKDTATA